MALAPRVLDEDHFAGADPAHLAVARGDLHARVEIDDVLPLRSRMPVEVVLGLDLAEDDAGGGKARRQPTGASRFREGDLHVLEVRLALGVDVEPVDLHGTPSRGIRSGGPESLASPPMNSAAPRSAQAVFAGWCYTGIHRRPATGCPRGALPAFSMCHVQGSPYFRKHRVALDWGMGRSHVRPGEKRVRAISLLGAFQRRRCRTPQARQPRMVRGGP